MQFQTSRFGTVECRDEETISFEHGLIGFPNERQFLLIPHGNSEFIAWLQSTTTPSIALPVASAHSIDGYPDVQFHSQAAELNLGKNAEHYAILVVISAKANQPPTVNLLAPVVVNTELRKGAQIILEGTRFTTREAYPGVARSESEASDQTQTRPAETQAEDGRE
jgi:flagellar assembly factor FliW